VKPAGIARWFVPLLISVAVLWLLAWAFGR
jgi:uncharacterized RDD family membrane protein YckC